MRPQCRFYNKFNLGDSDYVTPGKQLQYISEFKPDSIAIVYVDKDEAVTSITWRQLHNRTNQLAHLLMNKGVGRGSSIIVSLPNCIEHIIATFAIWKTGACYVPISSKTTEYEISEISRIVSPLGAFSEFEVPGSSFRLDKASMYDAMAGYSTDMLPDVLANPNMITLSGGTSGKLKLIRQNMASGMMDDDIRGWFYMSGMDFEQRQLLAGPLFHGAPHSAAFNGLFAGNMLVIARNLCPENVARLVKDYQIEFIQLVPTLMNRIMKLQNLKREDFSSIKALFHTGGYCSPFLKEFWLDLLSPEKVYEIYSMSEVIGITFIRGDEWLKHRGSVGLPLGGGKISIRDENGNELPPYEVGEIYMTPPAGELSDVKVEYINQDQLKEIAGGFRSVGDIGYVDNDGYLYFSDRRSDMIVTGGENVFAAEVETALLRHNDILDAVVVGIPDEEWGRRIHAVIEGSRVIPTDELKMFLRRFLLPYKIPKTFEYVKFIPRKESGKIVRDKILQDCIARGV